MRYLPESSAAGKRSKRRLFSAPVPTASSIGSKFDPQSWPTEPATPLSRPETVLSGPSNAPFLWSETRQELCESLPYYRSYQSGSYVKSGAAPLFQGQRKRELAVTRDSFVNGYLLAGWPSCRDVWSHGGKVIISHGGGKNATGDGSDSSDHPGAGDGSFGDTSAARKSGSNPSSPSKMQLREDQDEDDSVIAALIQTMRMKMPVVLIAGENYALLPMKLNCGFAVLGWYMITDGWAEKEEDDSAPGCKSFVRWKFRFEWIEAQGEPWWDREASVRRTQAWDPRKRKELFTKRERRSQQLEEENARRKGAKLAKAVEAGAAVEVKNAPTERQRKRTKIGPMTCTIAIQSSVSTDEPISAANLVCPACEKASPTVFDSGWICLMPRCQRFFEGARPDRLQFSDRFLAPRGDIVHGGFPGGREPWPLIPPDPPSDSLDQARGLWCRKCGRLSCRAVIYRPSCPHCGSRVGPEHGLPLISAPTLEAAGETIDDVAIVSPFSGIKIGIQHQEGLVAYSFYFPVRFGGCTVHLVQADVANGQAETVADGIYTGFQKASWPKSVEDGAGSVKRSGRRRSTMALPEGGNTDEKPTTAYDDSAVQRLKLVPFRRHPLRSASIKGAMLTQQFTVNYGMAYKHVVAMGTNPIDATTPECITSSMAIIKQRTAMVCPLARDPKIGGDKEDRHNADGPAFLHSSTTSEPLQPGFNEAYGCLYLPFQSMSFHDDGEPGLGPIVSSLSLGSEATMKFRVKSKFLVNSGRAHRDRPYLKDEMGVEARDRTVLTLRLRHGSVCVQEGAELQKRFEHAVDPGGFRVACTTRFIDPAVNGR